MKFAARKSECEVGKDPFNSYLSMDCLDVNHWKLGVAACYLRPRGNKPSKNFLVEKIIDEHTRSVLYTENLVSSV